MPCSTLTAGRLSTNWKWRGAKHVHMKARDFFNIRVIHQMIIRWENIEIPATVTDAIMHHFQGIEETFK